MINSKKKSITRGIIYAFSILLILYGVHVIVVARAMQSLSGLTRTVHNHPLVVSNASLLASLDVVKMHRSMKDIVLFEDPAMIQPTLAEIAALEKETGHQLRIVQNNILGIEGQKIVSEAIGLLEGWAPIRAGVIDKVKKGDKGAAAKTTYTEGAAHVAKLEEKMLELTKYARRKASGFLADTDSVYNQTKYLLMLLFSSLGIVTVAVVLLTIRRTLLGERELAEEREKLDVTLRSIGDGVIATDQLGRVTLLNEVGEQLTGWTEAEAQGQDLEKIFNIINEITRIPCENPVDKVLETNGIIGLANHTILIAKNGTERAIADSGAPIRNEKQEIIGIVLVFRDQSEERLYQDKISKSEEKYRLLSDNTLDMIWTMDLDLRFTYINRAVLTFTGHSPKEWVGSYLADHCDKQNLALMEDHFNQELAKGTAGNGICLEAEIVNKNGQSLPVEIRANVIFDALGRTIGIQGVSRDISERKKAEKRRDSLERQLIQAQKMESIGRLAGGVAHDFNNMLNVILGYTEMLLVKTEQAGSLYDDLREIHTAARRSTEITRQLLAFARQQTISPKVLKLNDTVGNLLKMLRRLIGEDIELVWLPDPHLLSVKIDPTQVDQIMANLCVNARDAITGVGKITISTRNTSFDEDYCRDHAGFIPGDYVMLAVSDDGNGIEKEIMANIFEPFFTTKGVGRGTGLGLSTVYGIVKQNRGFVYVYSELEKGTTIKIYLPRYSGEVGNAPKEVGSEIPQGSGETILLVEDEAAILKLGKRMLEKIGYIVIDTDSPERAVELAGGHTGKIDLLITDVVMPGMNGRDLANRLRTSQDELKVLFMSGYTADVIAHRGVLDDDVCFIEKPFSQTALAHKVREALAV